MPDGRKKSSKFPETRWSLVGRAAASDDLIRQKAITELLTAYVPGLRAFLVEGRRVPTDLADDLLQGFIADKVLAARLVRHAKQERGKFRNFVLKSLSNFVSTKLRGQYSARALAIGLDEAVAIAAPSDQMTNRFEQEWVQQVVRDALLLMETDCKKRGRSDLWDVFRLRVVEPMLHGTEPANYEQIVEQFGIQTPRQAINLLASAKRSFVNELRTAVGKYVAGEEEIDREIEDLRKIVDR